MPVDMCTRRLSRELQAIQKNPLKSPSILTKPNETNMLEWHYVIEGGSDTPYEGGFYHGKLLFPKEYPLKPPSVIMLTPSGRFKPNRRLCLSMSDFHPETWNPMWSVSTILTGLYSFMIETASTLGSVETSTAMKRKLACQSLDFNVKDPNFRKLFPELLELHKERQSKLRLQQEKEECSTNHVTLGASGFRGVGEEEEMHGLMAAAAGVVALLSLVFAMRFF